MFFPFGDDNRGKATAWSLFGNATAVARQSSAKHVSVKAVGRTVGDLQTLVRDGAQLTAAVACLLGERSLAERAHNVHQYLSTPKKQ